MMSLRVFQLARELRLSSEEIIRRIAALTDTIPHGHMSRIDPVLADKLRRDVARDLPGASSGSRTENVLQGKRKPIDRELWLRGAERILQVRFPADYAGFVRKHASLVVDGIRIHGAPTESCPESVVEATLRVRALRPDLSSSLIAIVLLGDRALCLETGTTSPKLEPLREIDLRWRGRDRTLGFSFEQFVAHHRSQEERFRQAYDRVRKRRQETERYRAMGGREARTFGMHDNALLPGPKDWHPIVSEVADYIVGLTAVRYSPRLGALEVDEFYAIDHPLYEPGAAIKNLIAILCAMARDYSGLPAFVFTEEYRSPDGRRSRRPRRVPVELVGYAAKRGIVLRRVDAGRIDAAEGRELFWSILDFPAETTKTLLPLEEAGYASRDLLAEVVAAGIWSREEATWLLTNASRPEAVLLGSDVPEDRLLHAESLQWGRAAVLAMWFHHAVRAQISGGFASEERADPPCHLDPSGPFWVYRSAVDFRLPWIVSGCAEVPVPRDEQLLISVLPLSGDHPDVVLSSIHAAIETKLLPERARRGIRRACLVLSYDAIGPEFLLSLAAEVVSELRRLNDRGPVQIICAPQASHQLDLEVERRMRRARQMRRFPSRRCRFPVDVLCIPRTTWETDAAFAHVAKSCLRFGRLATGTVMTGRFREEYVAAAAAVERLARRKSAPAGRIRLEPGVADALRSLLPRSGAVQHAFLSPPEFKAVSKSLPPSIREKLAAFDGGLVIVPVPFVKSEAPIASPPVSTPSAVTVVPEAVHRVAESTPASLERSRGVDPGAVRKAQAAARDALEHGTALAASFIHPDVFVTAMRPYILTVTEQRHRDEPRTRKETRIERYEAPRAGLWRLISRALGLPLVDTRTRKKVVDVSYTERVPYTHILQEPGFLRVGYSDGSEGALFPVFAVSPRARGREDPFILRLQIVSSRHMATELESDLALIRNPEIQDKETAAEQEAFAYGEAIRFFSTLLPLLFGKLPVQEAEKEERVFRLLWEELSLEKSVPIKNLSVHLFQSTGLLPAVIGTYRAATELFRDRSEPFVIVPRIYRPQREADAVRRREEDHTKTPIRDEALGDYPSLPAWPE